MTPDAARLALGVALLARPGLVDRATGTDPDDRLPAVTRVLGARYAVQGLAGVVADLRGCRSRGTARRPWSTTTDAALDLAHAASMVVVVVLDPRRRRPAMASALVAAALAAADLRSRRRLR